jgi:predicted RNA methylase
MIRNRHKKVKEGSLDQFFTENQEHYATKIIEFSSSKRVFVDTSCGTGELGVYLHQNGFQVLMFDVDDSNLSDETKALLISNPDTFSFTKKDWLSVQKKELPNDFILGFNPPFGHKAKTSRLFAKHGIMLGATIICWLSSHLSGARGRSWLPDGFIVTYREDIPDNAFRHNGNLFSARADFRIYIQDTEKHKAIVEKQKRLDLRPLPKGWKLTTLSSVLGTTKRQFPSMYPKSKANFFLASAGPAAGEMAYFFEGDRLFKILRGKTTKKELPSNKTRNIIGTLVIQVPKKFRNPQKLLDVTAPLFKISQRLQAGKRSVNMKDARRVIFHLEKSGN